MCGVRSLSGLVCMMQLHAPFYIHIYHESDLKRCRILGNGGEPQVVFVASVAHVGTRL